jgi:hypothetical protein
VCIDAQTMVFDAVVLALVVLLLLLLLLFVMRD